MVVKMSWWLLSLFLFKIQPSQNYSLQSYTSISVKLVPQIWCILLWLGFYSTSLTEAYRQSPLAYGAVTAAICQWSHNHWANCQHSPSVFFLQTATSLGSIFSGSGSLRNGCATIDILYQSHHRSRDI
jgi:hypothetical protein